MPRPATVIFGYPGKIQLPVKRPSNPTTRISLPRWAPQRVIPQATGSGLSSFMESNHVLIGWICPHLEEVDMG